MAISVWLSCAAALSGHDPLLTTPAGGGKAQGDAPLAYRDPGAGIIIFVESDRRHVCAIDKTGKVLWHRNLLSEEAEKIPSFNKVEPIIRLVGAPLDRSVAAMAAQGKAGPFAAICFRNRSCGLIDVRTGDLTITDRD